jgi:ABC-2 type transport system ATP-binding protein
MDTVLETTGLTRRFGRQLAVDRVSLSVPKGAVYGFLGRNGAGKTTAIRLVLGLLRADAGEIVLLGRRSTGRALRTPPGVGSLIETPAPYDHLTGRENLDLTRRLLGLPRTEIDRVLEVVELTTASDRRAGG